MVQFVDYLSSKVQFVDLGVSKAPREAAMEVFGDLDLDGEGFIEVTWLLAVS